MGNLTATKARAAKAGVGADGKPIKATYHDGNGLSLVCAASGARNWVLRVQVDGKRRDIGLGAFSPDPIAPNVFGEGDNRHDEKPLMLRKVLTLAEAREKAAALRKLPSAIGSG